MNALARAIPVLDHGGAPADVSLVPGGSQSGGIALQHMPRPGYSAAIPLKCVQHVAEKVVGAPTGCPAAQADEERSCWQAI